MKQEIHVCDGCGRKAGPGLDTPTVEGWARVSVEVGAASDYFACYSGVTRHACCASCFIQVLERLRGETPEKLAVRAPKPSPVSNVIPLEGGSYRTPPRGSS